jgi:hypothetical protein
VADAVAAVAVATADLVVQVAQVAVVPAASAVDAVGVAAVPPVHSAVQVAHHARARSRSGKSAMSLKSSRSTS